MMYNNGNVVIKNHAYPIVLVYYKILYDIFGILYMSAIKIFTITRIFEIVLYQLKCNKERLQDIAHAIIIQ